MDNYQDKEKMIIKQCHEGPFHVLITELSLDEFNDLVTKLIKDNDAHTLINLIAIYRDYNRNRIIDYFISLGDLELLLGFLDYCNDFDTPNNRLDQKYVVDKLLEKNDLKFIQDFLNSNSTYFLTDIKERQRLMSRIYDII